MAGNYDNELVNYMFDEKANTIRPVKDSDFSGTRNKNENIIAQFEGDENCEQFEIVIRRLRPDITWVD